MQKDVTYAHLSIMLLALAMLCSIILAAEAARWGFQGACIGLIVAAIGIRKESDRSMRTTCIALIPLHLLIAIYYAYEIIGQLIVKA